MDNESPLKAIIVVVSTALVCSVLVTVAAVSLQPIQNAYQDLERIGYIVGISGIAEPVEELSELEIIAAFQDLEPRIVDLERGTFDETYNPRTFDTREVATAPEFSVTIPTAEDLARLGQRSRLATIYLVRENDELVRIILPVYGQGMWSTIYGFVAIENDLNTIADMTIYEQGETPGIGDPIQSREWQTRWQGRKLYDEDGTLRFRIIRGAVDRSSAGSIYEVDGLTGATMTTNGVMNMVRYWFGPHGFETFLNNFSTVSSAGDTQ
ncbi:MAG: Na(+)-translocating NADH-quinone reductase subunit C [Pseudohongiellaceae bacterium]